MNKKIELYSEMYYDNKRPDDAEKAYGIKLNKQECDGANNFFHVFYDIQRSVLTEHAYEGYILDIFPAESLKDVRSLAEWYTDHILSEKTDDLTGLSLTNILARVEPKAAPEQLTLLSNIFIKNFVSESDDKPIAALETGIFNGYDAAPWGILLKLWVIQYTKYTLFIAYGTDE
jgi:hypothetical protein